MILPMMGLVFTMMVFGASAYWLSTVLPSIGDFQKIASAIFWAGLLGLCMSWGFAALLESLFHSELWGGMGFFGGYMVGVITGAITGLKLASSAKA